MHQGVDVADRGRVGLEVCIMNKFIKSVKAAKPCASFASTPAPAERTPEEQAVREGITAFGLKDHKCTFTCKNGFGGFKTIVFINL